MQRADFPEIKTERLRLRKLSEADWEMICYLRSDKEVNKYVSRPPAETKEEAVAFITKINTGVDSGASHYWVITKKDEDKMVGSICLWNFSEDRKTAETGYDLSPAQQGKGIMDEALKALITFSFNKLNLQTIEAYTHRENSPSIRLLERNGFVLIKGKTDPDVPDNIVFELGHRKMCLRYVRQGHK